MEKVAVDESKIEPFMPDIYKKLEWLSREELIKHFVSLEFNRFLTYYKNAPDLNILSKSKKQSSNTSQKAGRQRSSAVQKEGRQRSNQGQKSEFTRFFISAGSLEGIDPTNLIGLINQQTKKRDIEIGKIEIMKNFSFFEVDGAYTERLISQFENAEFGGKKIMVEVAQDKPATSERRMKKEKKGYGPRSNKSKPKKRAKK
jgi:ATP-dependent RNA helicase DeaD